MILRLWPMQASIEASDSGICWMIIQLRYISGKRILEARLIHLRGSRTGYSGSSCVIKFKKTWGPTGDGQIPWEDQISMDCRDAYYQMCHAAFTMEKEVVSLNRDQAQFNTGLPGQKHQIQKGNGNKSVQNMGRISRERKKMWVWSSRHWRYYHCKPPHVSVPSWALMPILELISGKHEGITLRPIRIAPEASDVVSWTEEMWVPFWEKEEDVM